GQVPGRDRASGRHLTFEAVIDVPGHPGTRRSGASGLSGTRGRSWHHVRMDLQSLAGDVWQRIVPGPAPEPGRWILVAVLVALLVVVLPPLWRYARLAVTIVHELGHAAVGIAVGRRFTGFVVSSD